MDLVSRSYARLNSGPCSQGVGMKKKVWLALAAGAIAGSTALAQTQSSDPSSSTTGSGTGTSSRQTSGQSTSSGSMTGQSTSGSMSGQAGDMQTTTGTVKSYKAGKKIVVTGADGKNHTLKLDESARVDGTLNPGDPVTVMWMTDSNGKQRVTSVSNGSAGSS